MRIPQSGTTAVRAPLDGTDRAIIGCLLKDARASVTAIARELRMGESTVRNRLRKLVDDGIVSFALITNPLQFGFQVWAMLEIQVQPSRIREVAEILGQEPRIHLVGIMSGSYDIYAGATLRSNEELVDLITRRLSQIPGIIRISTSTMLEMVKRSVSFGLPIDGDDVAKKSRASRTSARKH
jgi:Lrp/AsnC family transcriptional regulator for asnA, asnC and gidA